MGSDLHFLQRDLDGQRLPILERMARAVRKSKLAKKEPFKSMLKQLDKLEIK
jgi:hypothetical protein